MLFENLSYFFQIVSSTFNSIELDNVTDAVILTFQQVIKTHFIEFS